MTNKLPSLQHFQRPQYGLGNNPIFLVSDTEDYGFYFKMIYLYTSLWLDATNLVLQWDCVLQFHGQVNIG